MKNICLLLFLCTPLFCFAQYGTQGIRLSSDTAKKRVRKPGDPSAVGFFIGGGITAGGLSYSGNDFLAHNATQSAPIGPMASLGVDFFTDLDTRKLAFRVQLEGYKSEYHLSVKNGTSTAGVGGFPVTGDETRDITRNTISLNPQIIYYAYRSPQLKVFFGAGFGADVSTFPVNKTTTTLYPSGAVTPTVTSQSGTTLMNGFQLSLPVRAGVVLAKHFELNAAYILTPSISNSESNSVTIYQFGLNYLFLK